jgi:hypothetical protein
MVPVCEAAGSCTPRAPDILLRSLVGCGLGQWLHSERFLSMAPDSNYSKACAVTDQKALSLHEFP